MPEPTTIELHRCDGLAMDFVRAVGEAMARPRAHAAAETGVFPLHQLAMRLDSRDR